MNNETPRKNLNQAITQYFSPAQLKPTTRITRSKKTTISPSSSPTLKTPPDPEPDKAKRGQKRKDPGEQQLHPTSPPKASKMEKELSPAAKLKQKTFLDEIGTLISKQSETIKEQLQQHMTKQDEQFEQKIEVLKTQMSKYTETSEANTKIIL